MQSCHPPASVPAPPGCVLACLPCLSANSTVLPALVLVQSAAIAPLPLLRATPWVCRRVILSLAVSRRPLAWLSTSTSTGPRFPRIPFQELRHPADVSFLHGRAHPTTRRASSPAQASRPSSQSSPKCCTILGLKLSRMFLRFGLLGFRV